MNHSIFDELFAHSIGQEVLKYLVQTHKLEALVQETEFRAVQMLTEIKTILDDETLDDPACFRRIDAIVNAFHSSGVGTARHDF